VVIVGLTVAVYSVTFQRFSRQFKSSFNSQ